MPLSIFMPKGREWYAGNRPLGNGPTERPTMRDIAWAAGVYEGEGSVTKRGKGIRTNLVQKDAWLCLRLQALFGGTLSVMRLTSRPGSTYTQWSLGGVRTEGFLYTIFTMLSPRRRAQIRKVLGR